MGKLPTTRLLRLRTCIILAPIDSNYVCTQNVPIKSDQNKSCHLERKTYRSHETKGIAIVPETRKWIDCKVRNSNYGNSA